MSAGVASDAVDIVLPTWARPHTLPWAIASVLGQTHPHFTLHVIGDGCGDDTEEVVRRFPDPRVRFHRFPKGYGFGYAHRNRVLATGDAPCVAYMTDDDLWFPDHLRRGVAGLREGADLVAFRPVHVQFPDVLDPWFFAFDWRLGGAGALLRHWFMGAVSCVHRRQVFDAVGYWDEGLFRFGDRDFYNRVRTSPLTTRYVDQPSVLRFYALHWDDRYGALPDPPQKRYADKVRDPGWRQALADDIATGSRGGGVRRRQIQDFLAFAVRSGPRFVRYWWQRRRAR